MNVIATVALDPDQAHRDERTILETPTLRASLFRYVSGIVGLRLSNTRGELVVLPWMGQIIWQARFDGTDLAMRGPLDIPQPAAEIGGTYGGFAFHSGLLRNGVPAKGDDHAAHGEFACAPMRAAWLDLVTIDGETALRLVSERDHVIAFGPHYRARPSITLRAGQALFDVSLNVENRSGQPMELMYMLHANFAFVQDGRIGQSVPYDPEHVATRRVIPAHVAPTAAYRAFLDTVTGNPGRMEYLREPALYDPEQVFYIRDQRVDAEQKTLLMLRHPDGAAFAVQYRPDEFPVCARWIVHNADYAVAAFALPATCEPEGYSAEKAKGTIRLLPAGDSTQFTVRLGHLTSPEADVMAAHLASLSHAVGECA
ncbi:hypothetical protein AA103196_2647 [Ameyamaea chiangmaiensis NBRC 103196]|uniref:DUF4432 family protein n=1 Tax=Ameyamaea chiangmaiensis TaxID=442969 RepID=A0A850P7Q2_9PROT|nr:DUF4432 family protein [Ameyamaea chiangmaiensis]MBS4074137.1 DUF4432 family protein [Ameyamaea chiangmaiensis]NVN39948.1 DUF4432 family protein [Ameyamaea chiangmaiensis]GBQ71007.1 hypothetical protein AA103196_2647 [Ameyamaea chiangmaiensis NBRC 103196]